jgi:hypothetical protein
VRAIAFLIITIFIRTLGAQERIGVLTDNYLPVNQIMINPALMVDQRPWLSVNLAGVNVYGRTNFFEIPDDRLGFFKYDYELEFGPPTKQGKMFLHGEAMGPSATVAIGNHSFGLHTAVRAYGFMNRMPAVMGEIIADEGVGNVEDGIYEVKNGRVKALSWGEVGLSYGKVIFERNEKLFEGGITLNRIFGLLQGSLIIDEGVMEVENARGTLRRLDGRSAYTEPAFSSGSGWGLNLGVNYKKMLDYTDAYKPHSRTSACKWLGYKYRVGVSLLDLGYVRMREQALTAALPDTAPLTAVENINEEVLGLQAGEYTGSLPTALSAQFDYLLFEEYGVYVNSMVVQRLTYSDSYGAERANLFSLAPRIERSWFSASVSLSMVEYTVPQLGMYVRIGPLAIGSDHITPFFIKQDIWGASIYAYLNIPLQVSPGCRERESEDYKKWICPVW